MKRVLKITAIVLGILLLLAGLWIFYVYNYFADLAPDRDDEYRARMHYLPDPAPDTAFDLEGTEGWIKRRLHNKLMDKGPYLVAYPLTQDDAKPAVIILPGGAYVMRAEKHEGVDVAKWLNSQGVAGFVLNYRLQQHPVPVGDVETAIRYVRSRATEFNILPDKVGVLGFSAGGHLAATSSTLLSGEAQPDFTVLAYAVIHMDGPLSHDSSRLSLLGDNPSQDVVDAVSPLKQVTPDTPPAFIWAPKTDEAVPWQNSSSYAEALDAAGVANELHIFPEGKHGSGLAQDEQYASTWPTLMINWLKSL